MKLRPLGRTGLSVSPYCLGTMMFGSAGNRDEADCARIVHRALEAGINVVDTADVYGGAGETERIVGRALRGRRDEVVLATKFSGPMGPGANQRGGSRHWITVAVEGSLRRLGVDHIDLYQLHHPEPGTDVEETLSALGDLLSSGKVRTIGHSNLPATDIVEAQWVSERRGLPRFRTEQPTYSILNRGVERDVLPTCEKYGLGTLTWSPLAMGLLTGKYRDVDRATVSTARMHWVPQHMTDERKHAVVEELAVVAAEAGISLTHLAMAFVVGHPGVTSAIIGPRTPEQLDDLLAGSGTRLDDSVLDAIDRIVPPGVDISPLDVSYVPPQLADPVRRRRGADRVAA